MSLANTRFQDRTPNVDVHDPQYQADKAFAPDKLHLWRDLPTEGDGWVLAHNAVRYELVQLKKAITAVGTSTKLEQWQVDAVQAYMKYHLVHVQEHHRNEDDVFNPAVRKRIVLPDKLEADHVAIIECMDAVERATNELAVGATLAALAELWTRYENLMLPHLWEEETIGLPLVRAFFTPKEVNAIVQTFIKNSDPVAMGSMAHVMGSKAATQTFMRHHGIPLFVWHLPGKGFKSLRSLYRKKMQSQIDSLVAGKPIILVHRTKADKAALRASAAGDENAVEQCLSPMKRSVRVLQARYPSSAAQLELAQPEFRWL